MYHIYFTGDNMSLISLEELVEKDVINVVNGKNLGNVCDMEINVGPGNIITIKVSQGRGLFSFFRKEEGIVIPWDQVVKIGDDVIIVNYLDRLELQEQKGV